MKTVDELIIIDYCFFLFKIAMCWGAPFWVKAGVTDHKTVELEVAPQVSPQLVNKQHFA